MRCAHPAGAAEATPGISRRCAAHILRGRLKPHPESTTAGGASRGRRTGSERPWPEGASGGRRACRPRPRCRAPRSGRPSGRARSILPRSGERIPLVTTPTWGRPTWTQSPWPSRLVPRELEPDEDALRMRASFGERFRADELVLLVGGTVNPIPPRTDRPGRRTRSPRRSSPLRSAPCRAPRARAASARAARPPR